MFLKIGFPEFSENFKEKIVKEVTFNISFGSTMSVFLENVQNYDGTLGRLVLSIFTSNIVNGFRISSIIDKLLWKTNIITKKMTF